MLPARPASTEAAARSETGGAYEILDHGRARQSRPPVAARLRSPTPSRRNSHAARAIQGLRRLRVDATCRCPLTLDVLVITQWLAPWRVREYPERREKAQYRRNHEIKFWTSIGSVCRERSGERRRIGIVAAR